jgi:hypothetical protein
MSFPFSSFSEDLESSYRRLEFIPRTTEVDDQGYYVEDENVSLENFDVISLAEKVIENSSHDEKLKGMLMTTIKKLHESVVRENSLEYEN